VQAGPEKKLLRLVMSGGQSTSITNHSGDGTKIMDCILALIRVVRTIALRLTCNNSLDRRLRFLMWEAGKGYVDWSLISIPTISATIQGSFFSMLQNCSLLREADLLSNQLILPHIFIRGKVMHQLALNTYSGGGSATEISWSDQLNLWQLNTFSQYNKVFVRGRIVRRKLYQFRLCR
jgi:hypothetical protein